MPKAATLSLFIVTLAFLQYTNTLSHDYAWDDNSVILNNRYTQQGLAGIKDIWTKSVYISKRPIYRPIPQTTFALEKHFFPKGNPWLGHFINISLYAFCCLLLFHFFRLLLAEYHLLFAFLASLLFIVHPIHTEVVANIKSRDEILALSFCLGSLLFFIRYLSEKKPLQIALSLLLFVMACLSKLNAITVLAIFPLLYYYLPPSAGSSSKKKGTYSLSMVTSGILEDSSQFYDQLNLGLKIAIGGGVLSIMGIALFWNADLLLLLAISLPISLMLFFFNKLSPWEFTGLTSLLIAFFLFFNLNHTIDATLLLFFLYCSIHQQWKIKYFIPLIFLFIFHSYPNPAIASIVSCGLFYLIAHQSGKWLNYALVAFSLATVSVYIYSSLEVFIILQLPVIYAFTKSHRKAKKWIPFIFAFGLLFIFSKERFLGLVQEQRNLEVVQKEQASAFSEFSVINNSLIYANAETRLPTIFKIQLEYLKKSFFPHPLSHNYGYNMIPNIGWNNPWPWGSIIVHLFLFLYVLINIRKRDPIAFGIFFYLAALSIYSNMFITVPDTMAERFLFFPSVGFCLAFVFLLAGITRVNFHQKPLVNISNSSFYASLIVLLFLGFYKTFDRNKDWKNNETLAQNTIVTSSNSALIHANYGITKWNRFKSTKDAKVLQDAIAAMERALVIHPDYFNVMLDLGNMYLDAGEVEKSKAVFLRSKEIHTQHPHANFQLGLIAYSQQNYKEGITFFEVARAELKNQGVNTQEGKFTEELYLFLARCYFNMGQLEKSTEVLLESAQAFTQNPKYYILLAKMYAEENDLPNAIPYLEKALQIQPNDSGLLELLRFWKSKQ